MIDFAREKKQQSRRPETYGLTTRLFTQYAVQSLPQSLHIAITRSNLGAPVFVALVLVNCPHLRRLLHPVLPVHVGARPSETPFVDFYHRDLDLQELILECQHFKHNINQNQQQTQAQQPTMAQLYGLESTFPNIEVVLRIHLTLMPTNCTGERSFSKMKIIKNHLRSCMLQQRLTALSIMSIECDLLDVTDYSNIFDSCASQKS